MKTNLLFLLALFCGIISFSQVTLYSENFNDDLGKGATGITPTVDLSGVDWDIDITNASLSNQFRFNVRNLNNGSTIFEARNVGTAIWLSPTIDISAHTAITFTIDASRGGANLENSDTLTTQYSLDGGTWTNASTNGVLSANFASVQVNQTGLNGTSLEIRVIAVNNRGNERHRIDNIEITGLGPCVAPVNPITFNAINAPSNSIALNWNLDSCNEEFLIIAKEGSAVSSIPTGDGSLYTADANFGSGTEIVSDEFIVYKGTLDAETISALALGNTYFFTVFGRNGTTWSTGTQVNFNLDYCTSVGTRDDFDTNTTLVSFGAINNNTVIDDGAAYHDYTAQSTSIELGASEDLIINLDTDGNFNVYSYAWIDWNRDGDFDDASETYDLGFAVNTDNGPTSNSPLSISVPNDASLGDTRMRVVSEFYFNIIPTNGPCDGALDGEVEDYTVTILPAISYTYNNVWTPSDPNGVATVLNDITVISGTANFNTTTNCNNLIVNPEGNVTVDSGVTLTINNEMVLESSSTRYSSLISDGTISGTVNYKRHVNAAPGSGASTTANDLISAPLTGQSFGDFRSSNSNIVSGTIGGNPAFLFGPFNPISGAYINYSPSDDTSTIDAGIGYRTGSSDGETYTFTGSIETGNINVPIVSGGANNWNLIGNPYPSYLKVQDFLNNMSNSGLIDENAVGIYGYDGVASDGWVIYNLATTTATSVITPGQGFFVNAEASGNIQFTPSMRDTGIEDDFIAGRSANTLVYLKLNVSNMTHKFSTDFYFNDNASLALDPGFDATVWNNTPPSLSVYSHLVENNNGRAFALQALHSNDLLNVTIPLGVDANNSSDITFSITESTIPDSVNVYLEDTVENSLTLLTEEDYILTPNSALSGTGRFYLRFVENELNVNEIELETLNIFANQTEKSIVIQGLLQQQTYLKLYDIQGRVVANSTLKLNTNEQSIKIAQLTSGIYVVHVQSNSGIKTKKVILN